MSDTGRQPARGFTLVEALVILAVVALVCALLIPSLSIASESAKQAVCAAAVRGLQTANIAFAGDHADRFAPGAIDEQGAGNHRWHGVRDAPGRPFRPEGGSLTAYIGPDGARGCPTFAPTARELADAGAGFERGCGGYGYNQAFVGVERAPNAQSGWSRVSDREGAPMGAFREPARTIAFADAALAHSTLIEYSFVEPRFWPELPASVGYRADPSMHFRHRIASAPQGAGVANTAWLDAHVTTERRAFTWSSGIYSASPDALGLGWTGDTDDNSLFDYE